MFETVLCIWVLFNILRSLGIIIVIDNTGYDVSACLINLFAITYYNKNRLTKFGLVVAVLADLVLLPGAIFSSFVGLIAEGFIYFVIKLCVKHD